MAKAPRAISLGQYIAPACIAPLTGASVVIAAAGSAPLQVRDVRTGAQLALWDKPVFSCRHLVAMPCGLVAAASFSRIVVFRAKNGTRSQELVTTATAAFEKSDVVGLGFADKHLLSASTNKDLRVWAMDKSEKVRMRTGAAHSFLRTREVARASGHACVARAWLTRFSKRDWRVLRPALILLLRQLYRAMIPSRPAQFAEKSRFKTAEVPSFISVLSDSTVAVFSASRRTAEVWDWRRGQAVCKIHFSANAVCSAVLSDGRLAIGDASSNILIGDPERWAAAQVISNDAAVLDIVAAKGGYFVTSDSMGNTKIWRDGKCEQVIEGDFGSNQGMLAIVGARVVTAVQGRNALLVYS